MGVFSFLWILMPYLLSGNAYPTVPSEVYEFPLEELARRNRDNGASLTGDVLQFQPPNADQRLWLSDTLRAWGQARYLILELEHESGHSAILEIDFFRQGGEGGASAQQGVEGNGEDSEQLSPRLTAKIGVLPFLPTRLILPLSHLDGQEIFLDRFPRQLKGTVRGNRIDPREISRAGIRLLPQEEGHRTRISIRRVALVNELPPKLPAPAQPVVDSFGQWTARDWPGKVHSSEELHRQLGALRRQAAEAEFPGSWSRFGGWKEKRFEASGFFRVHHDGNRWWLVDPEGYAFLSMGMDCVREHSDGVLSGQEDLFAWLPPADAAPFSEIYRDRGDMRLVDFYKSNLMRVYGKNWRAEWDTLATGLLRSMRFNTVGNWSDTELARRFKMPYVLPLGNFPSTEVRLYRDFPDVFSAEYRREAEIFARQLEGVRDDPYLIGYFLRNEPHWAFGANNLAFEMFATATPSATRDRFIDWIRERYGDDLERFNAAWALELSSLEDLREARFSDPPSAKADEDLWAFSEVMVTEYVGVVCDAVERVDPDHLNLGMRYAWLSSELLYKAGERFDVFSINGYSFPGPPPTAEIARRSGKPLMIGEFHFGATDAGLPSTGIQGVADQKERARAYRYYTEQGFSRPEVIGLHYFQLNDQPIFGRFDGENYNIGFLDITLRPYAELSKAARSSHERMYEVATGKVAPMDSVAVKAPQIYF